MENYEIYKEMYLELFNAASDAIELIANGKAPDAIPVLGEAQKQLRFNLGAGHVCGALAVKLTALL